MLGEKSIQSKVVGPEEGIAVGAFEKQKLAINIEMIRKDDYYYYLCLQFDGVFVGELGKLVGIFVGSSNK